MQNIEATIQKEYANSPILTKLIRNMNQYLDQTINFDAFFYNIWDIDTASGYGLDVWGRIVGVTRVLDVPGEDQYFGFNEADDDSIVGFNQAPFYNGEATTSNFSLTDDSFRTMIFAKALANISNGSIQSINQILMNLFGSQGQCWCTDGLNMTMTYTFAFALSPVDQAIVAQSGVLPRPPGVSASIVQP